MKPGFAVRTGHDSCAQVFSEWHRPGELSSWPQHPARLVECGMKYLRGEMLKHLGHDHLVEELGAKGHLLAVPLLRSLAQPESVSQLPNRFGRWIQREDLDAPPGQKLLELTGPDGSLWSFGADDEPLTVIRGSAFDLCNVAGQRAIGSDTDLAGTGPDADEVLALVRTFA